MDWNNKEQVISAVKADGKALYHASSQLKNDREIVLAAVRQNGYALEYVGENLKMIP